MATHNDPNEGNVPSEPKLGDSEAVSEIANPHVEAVLDGRHEDAFSSSYEHFGSFLSWSRSG